MCPRGSKPAHIYGLAKVHKEGIPLRPIVSIPGTSYDKIGKWVSRWLEKVLESKINTSSDDVRNSIRNLKLASSEVLISLDVSSLYTNVPVSESIEKAAKRLYEECDNVPVDINTFMELT